MRRRHRERNIPQLAARRKSKAEAALLRAFPPLRVPAESVPGYLVGGVPEEEWLHARFGDRPWTEVAENAVSAHDTLYPYLSPEAFVAVGLPARARLALADFGAAGALLLDLHAEPEWNEDQRESLPLLDRSQRHAIVLVLRALATEGDGPNGSGEEAACLVPLVKREWRRRSTS